MSKRTKLKQRRQAKEGYQPKEKKGRKSRVFFQKREEFILDPKWCVVEGQDNAHCVLMLAGRTQKQNLLPSIYWYNGFRDYRMAGITTTVRAWYPAPMGAQNQWDAVEGLPHAIRLVENAVRLIGHKFQIPKNRIVLLGFSAGGVMAIQVAAHSKEPYAGVVCQSGAILQPRTLPRCHCPTPFLLTHSQDDDAFEWEERYLPMRGALEHKGYNLTVVESPCGGHSLNEMDIAVAKLFIRRCFTSE